VILQEDYQQVVQDRDMIAMEV